MEINAEWLRERGALNDAKIIGMKFDNSQFLVYIDDEWANYEGLPGYLGPGPGAIEVGSLANPPRIDADVTRELLSDVEVETKSDGSIKVTLTCFGQHSIVATGKSIRWVAGAVPKA